MATIFAIVGTALVVLFGSAVVFSVPGVPGSCGGKLQTGRFVESYTDNVLGTSFRAYGDGAVINAGIGIGDVVVEPRHVLLGGAVLCDIPEKAQHVTVYRERGRLRIAADGQDVYTTDKLWW
ncbi:MAG: hypothetical protein KDA63_09475 [Planctomycetales bacterium]|nr:hypothetical protein [Planctomycetales bacterium]